MLSKEKAMRKISSNKKAFTLIELLVVISIIALLLSILMPGLQLAKAKAKNLLCTTNLKGIITAWHMYSGDYGEKLMSSEVRYQSPPDERPYWVWTPTVVETGESVIWSGTADSYNPTQKEREEGLKRGVIWPYLETVDVFHCQSDKSKGGNFRSYSMPDFMNGSEFWLQGAYKTYKGQGEIVNPAGRIVLLEESDPRGCLFGSFLLDPREDEWSDPLTVWHGGASAFAFADGHAEIKKWDQETVAIFTDVDPQTGKPITLTPTTPGGIDDVEWMHRGWSRAKDRDNR